MFFPMVRKATSSITFFHAMRFIPTKHLAGTVRPSRQRVEEPCHSSHTFLRRAFSRIDTSQSQINYLYGCIVIVCTYCTPICLVPTSRRPGGVFLAFLQHATILSKRATTVRITQRGSTWQRRLVLAAHISLLIPPVACLDSSR